jgi:hypothetical protein
MTTMKKHVDNAHVIIVKKIEEEVNAIVKRSIEKKPTKKRPYVSQNARSKFLFVKNIFKKDDKHQKDFLQTLVL